jgi:type II secretory pathway component PulJ
MHHPQRLAQCGRKAAEPKRDVRVDGRHGGTVMQTFVGMILGALLLVCGVYVYDSMQTSSVASGQVAQANRTIVNWDVAKADWDRLKTRTHEEWVKISSR